MTVREDREVRAPPAMTLAALGTAAENLGFSVRDIRVREGLLLATTRPSLRGASLGFIISARARRFNEGTQLSLDATPLLGSWSLKSADRVISDLVHEFQLVMSAPQARIRRPKRTTPDRAPFGVLPQLLGIGWVALAVLFYGVLAGGWWWAPAGLAVCGGALLLFPRATPWWNRTLVALAVLSLPFGVIGAIARRLAHTNLLWAGTKVA